MRSLEKQHKKLHISVPLSIFILLFFFLFSVLSCFFITVNTRDNFLKSLSDDSLTYLDRLLTQTITNLDAYVDDYRLLIFGLSKNSSLIRLITEKGTLSMEDRLYCENQCMVYFETMKKLKPETMGGIVLGINGYINTDDTRKSINVHYPYCDTEWFQKAISNKSEGTLLPMSISLDFYNVNSALYNKQVTTVSYPIRDYDNSIIGAVFCFIDPSKLSSRLNLTELEDFDEIFLINSENKIVLHSDYYRMNVFSEPKAAA